MRKEVLVTRSCTTYIYDCMVVNETTCEVTSVSVSSSKKLDPDSEKGMKALRSLVTGLNNDLILVKVKGAKEIEEIRGMSLDDFMKYSKPIKR